MPIIFPTQNTLCDVFGTSSAFPRPKTQAPTREHPLKTPIFSAWSAVDTVKDKAGQLSNEAVREFEKASSKAQQKAGAIELYSAKYYAACTFGGLLACVRSPCPTQCKLFSHSPGHYTYSRDSVRSRQMPTPGRFETLQGQLRSLEDDRQS